MSDIVSKMSEMGQHGAFEARLAVIEARLAVMERRYSRVRDVVGPFLPLARRLLQVARAVRPLAMRTDGRHFPATIQAIRAQIDDPQRYASQVVHLAQLADSGYRASYNGSVLGVVDAMLGELRTTTRHAPVALDFGCWSGTTSRYISDVLGIGCVGAEIDETCLEFARRFLETWRVSFVQVDQERIRCEDETFDLVLANAVFANMFPGTHRMMMLELIRVTKPGGIVIVIDSNNPDSPEVQARLRNLYQLLEGDGGSYLNSRRAYIDTIRPGTAPNDVAARETCYSTRDEIEAYLAGARPATRFEPGSLRTPYALSAPLAAPSTVTDYKIYRELMSSAGMEVTCGPGYPAAAGMTTESCFVLIGKKQALGPASLVRANVTTWSRISSALFRKRTHC